MQQRILFVALMALLGAPIVSFASDYIGGTVITSQTPYGEQLVVTGALLGTRQANGFGGSIVAGSALPVKEISSQVSDVALVTNFFATVADPARLGLKVLISPKNVYTGTLSGRVEIPISGDSAHIIVGGAYEFGWGLRAPDPDCERYRLDRLSGEGGFNCSVGSRTLIELTGVYELSNATIQLEDNAPYSSARLQVAGPAFGIVVRPSGSAWQAQIKGRAYLWRQDINGNRLPLRGDVAFTMFRSL